MSTMLHQVTAAARTGWAWWTGELAGLLPRRLRGQALETLVLCPCADGVTLTCRTADGGEPAPLLEKASRAPVRGTLRLPPSLALARTVSLTAAAEENLQEVVSFQLDRYTPFEPSEVHLGCRVVGRDADAEAITVAVAIAQRSDVAALADRAAAQGVTCTKVVVAAEAFEIGLQEDLPLDWRTEEDSAAPSGRAHVWLWSLAALLLLANLGLPLLRGHAQLTELRREVETMRKEAQAVAALRDDVEQRSEQAAVPLQRWQRTPLSSLLTELTRLVPDTGWVTQLEIEPGSVQVTGFAASANALIPALEGSPAFSNAAFRSPVTQDAVHGVEQFHLSVDLRKRNE